MTGAGARRFVATSALALAVTGLCLAWLARDGTIDFSVAGYFATPSGFPLQNAATLSRLGHTGLRWVALAIWLSALVAAAAGWRAPAWRRWRGPLAYFCLAAAATTGLVALLRSASAHSCPWDLEGFGGAAAWFPLFDAPGAAPGPGHCWPSGHAAGGYALLAGYFALRDHNRACARAALALALALGLAMSAVQVARGAHFVSHTLWSLWFAWLCSFFAYVAWGPKTPDGPQFRR
ncbi:MAG: phosphatase PAP2 family protein [Burkholderiales bacterium]|nr:phosphatase PAP2 family protein [Burkholderiales bacterium]